MNLGFTEMAFIFVLALIIFGPKKLPEIGHQIGKALAEFRRASNEFKWQLEAEMRQIEAEAAREKIAKTVPQAPPAETAPAPGEGQPGNGIKPPDMEIYPTTMGLEFRPTNSSQAAASAGSTELVDPETVKPEELKSPDA